MADKRPHSKLANTSHMEPYRGGGAHDHEGANDRRGLAQFEKQRPRDADYGSSHGGPSRGGAMRGNQRWGGGGGPSEAQGPPRGLQPKAQPVKEREDDDLRNDRMNARYRGDDGDDDGMVAVSGSQWGDHDTSGEERVDSSRRGRKRQPEPEEEYEVVEDEVAAPKKRKKKSGGKGWLWAMIGMMVVGGGGAAAAVIISNNEAAETKRLADEAEKKAADELAEKKRKAKEDAEKAEKEESERRMNEEIERKAKEAAAKLDADKPTGPAEWAPSVESKNPWALVPAAPANSTLGLSNDEATNTNASLRTGFRPAAAVTAPTKAYRLSQHEVTWGELTLATNIPELVTMARPSWFPKNPVDAEDVPATNVPWDVARKFCQGMGGDLPSEAEWEWAARGPDKRPFPWGSGAIENSKVRIFAVKPIPVAPVKTQKLDVTPGDAPIYDLLGNAQEWTRDAWKPSEPGVEDPRSATHKALRGWPLVDKGQSIPAEGSSYRAPGCAASSCAAAEGAALERIGFRCSKPE